MQQWKIGMKFAGSLIPTFKIIGYYIDSTEKKRDKKIKGKKFVYLWNISLILGIIILE